MVAGSRSWSYECHINNIYIINKMNKILQSTYTFKVSYAVFICVGSIYFFSPLSYSMVTSTDFMLKMEYNSIQVFNSSLFV